MDVITAPDVNLRVKAKPVKKIRPQLLKIIKEMVLTTANFKDPEGVGLAANQIGENERFFIAKEGKKFITVINPQITFTSKRVKSYFEGCLSIPNYYGTVKRHTSIRVTYLNEAGIVIKRNLKGIIAWIFQHEIDHLNGILFPDRVLEQKGRFFKFTGRDKRGQDIFEEVNI